MVIRDPGDQKNTFLTNKKIKKMVIRDPGDQKITFLTKKCQKIVIRDPGYPKNCFLVKNLSKKWVPKNENALQRTKMLKRNCHIEAWDLADASKDGHINSKDP